MRRSRGLWLTGVLALLAWSGGARSSGPAGSGAAAPRTLRVMLCPIVATAEGADVDDAGAAVELVVDGRSPERRRLGRVLGGCREVPPAASSAELARAECRDPHVDRSDVVRVLRPAARAVVIEVTAVDDASQNAAPGLREEVAVGTETHVSLEIGGTCTM
jgi:hypothetical protein